MCRGAPDPDIVVSKGSVSNDNTGGEGSGLSDVGNEVIADDDVAQEGAIVIKQFHPGKEQFGVKNVRTACGTDLNTFPDSFTILSFISEKVGQTFLLTTISQSLKDGSLLQHMKGIRR